MAVFGRGLPREEDDAVRGRGRRAKSGAWRSRRIRFRHLNAPFVKVDSRRRTARKLGAMKSDGNANSSDTYNHGVYETAYTKLFCTKVPSYELRVLLLLPGSR